jgi:hypothetical protein
MLSNLLIQYGATIDSKTNIRELKAEEFLELSFNANPFQLSDLLNQ